MSGSLQERISDANWVWYATFSDIWAGRVVNRTNGGGCWSFPSGSLAFSHGFG
jgi:hypothetical protein